MLQTGFQHSAEGKLALSAVPRPFCALQLCSGLQNKPELWALNCCCPEGKNEASVCPKRGKKCPSPCRGWDCPPPLPVCTFCVLGAELSSAECAFVRAQLTAGPGKAASDFPVSQAPHLWTFVPKPDLSSLTNRQSWPCSAAALTLWGRGKQSLFSAFGQQNKFSCLKQLLLSSLSLCLTGTKSRGDDWLEYCAHKSSFLWRYWGPT